MAERVGRLGLNSIVHDGIVIPHSCCEYTSQGYHGIGFEQIGHYTLITLAKSESKE